MPLSTVFCFVFLHWQIFKLSDSDSIFSSSDLFFHFQIIVFKVQILFFFTFGSFFTFRLLALIWRGGRDIMIDKAENLSLNVGTVRKYIVRTKAFFTPLSLDWQRKTDSDVTKLHLASCLDHTWYQSQYKARIFASFPCSTITVNALKHLTSTSLWR